MNKNMLIVTGLVVVVLLLGGGYLLNQNAQNAKMAQEKAMMKDEASMHDETPKGTDEAMMKDDKMAEDDSMMHSDLVMMASDPTLGSYVTASNDMTLYVFDNDTKNVSNCTGQCSVNWPAYLAKGDLPSAMPAHLGTFTRTDGSKQYTWNGLPLYFYSGDKKVGDTNGDGVGGTWHVAK